ncbi:SGNH hydrolase-type esterase domain-containing protein [Lipomyces oligophaga]|uniref:SGNH hydrolase-type esterase domain-containing protein n=1 Tax=Lipomyces oligophaga TaxID=45792 RepID=UPI0034CEF1B2
MALNYDKIVLFGDSITQYCYNTEVASFCLGPALQHVFTRKFDIIQRGYGGYTSAHAKLMIDKVIAHENQSESKVKLMIIFFGTNDAARNAIQHVDLETYKANLRYMVAACQASGIKVILIGAGPFNAHQWWVARPDTPKDRTTLQAREYCDALVAVARELAVPAVPMWDLVMAKLGWKQGDPVFGLEEEAIYNPLSTILSDGLHYKAGGYQVEYDGIMDVLKTSYPELYPDNVPLRLPEWAALTSFDVLTDAI